MNLLRSLPAAWILAAACSLPGSAAAQNSPSARLSCRPEAGPGRVLCELEIEAAPGKRLTWADAVVVDNPSFASPLRARVGPSQAVARTPNRLRLPLAFAATEEGRGDVIVRARWVQCPPKGACASGSLLSKGQLRVGSVAGP